MPQVIRQSTRFQRDIKRLLWQGADLSKLEGIIESLFIEQALDERFRDHSLSGNWKGYRECHVQTDWLLIYRIDGDELQLVRTGSHSDLF